MSADSVAPVAAVLPPAPHGGPRRGDPGPRRGRTIGGCRKFLLPLRANPQAADRKERKRDRWLKESGRPAGKTFGTLDEEKRPVKNPAPPAAAAGGWLGRTGGEPAGLWAGWKRKHTHPRPGGVGPGADPAARIHGLAALRWTDKLVQQAAGGPAGTAFGSPAQASWIAVIALDDHGGQLIARCITR